MTDTDTDMPMIRNIAPWFGTKAQLAPAIVDEFGEHRAYWEPACGGLSVLFAKPETPHESINDLHGDIINLARVVASDDAPTLYDRLQRALMSEDLLDQSREQIARDPDPDAVDADRAYWYFILVWGCRRGVAGMRRMNYQMAVRWTYFGGSAAGRFASAVDSLPWWHRRRRRVEILRRDLLAILPRIADEPRTVIYLDPPYFRDGARRGHSEYLFEFQGIDHERLAFEAGRFKNARVVVSYYDHPRLAELYPADRWTTRRIARHKNLHQQTQRGRSGKVVTPEVLLINGPSYAAPEP